MRPERRAVPGLAEDLPALRASLGDDGSPRNVMRVAEGYWLVGRPTEAIAILEPLLERDASLIAPRVLLAWCLEDAGRTEDARACRAEIAALDPANPYGTPAPDAAPAADPPASETRAAGPATESAAESGAGPEAVSSGESVYLAPDDEREAEPERSLTAEELSRIPPGPLYSATLAEIFAKQGFQEKAIEIYREINRAQPGRTDVLERIEVLQAEREGKPS